MNVYAEHVFGAEPAYVIKGLDPNARAEGNELVALYDATPVWNDANRFNDFWKRVEKPKHHIYGSVTKVDLSR